MEFLGCKFFKIYSIQKTDVRWAIKNALKISSKEFINPRDCIKTEKKQDPVKIEMIMNKFDIKKFYEQPIDIFNWGCGLLILNGHHRLTAAGRMGLTKIRVEMYRYQSC